ncbi:MAG: GNAT family N-acetyltransferase [Pseudomonadota bacterium]
MIALTGIPVLETERLLLRAPQPQDGPGYVAFMMSERAQYVGGPLPERRAWYAFATEFGHWATRQFGMWAVTEKGSDICLGYVGCWCPQTWPEAEIGWTLWPEAEGRGIAYEAALAARAHAYGTLGWATAVSYIDYGNERSARLAERLGARLDPEALFPGHDMGAEPCRVYRHPAPEDLA